MDIKLKQIEKYCQQKTVQEALGISSPPKTEFLAQGEYNINYLLLAEEKKRFVFRLNTASQLGLEDQISYEYNALKALEKSGVTPRALFVDPSKKLVPYGLLIMDFLEGRPLDYKQDLARAAKLFATIHSLAVEPFEQILIKETGLCRARVNEGRKWLEDYFLSPRSDKKIRGILDRLLNYCQKESRRDVFFENQPWTVVNNTEVNSHNFIIGDREDFIIDWEKPVLSDPAQDITQFLAPTTTLWRTEVLLTAKDIELFYQAYAHASGKKTSELKERVEAYKPFLYLRALSWCANAWLAYSADTRDISNLQTFEKIKSYLSEDFLRILLREYIAI